MAASLLREQNINIGRNKVSNPRKSYLKPRTRIKKSLSLLPRSPNHGITLLPLKKGIHSLKKSSRLMKWFKNSENKIFEGRKAIKS